MTGLERTIKFINHEKVDRPPIHPIIMLFAANYAGIPYSKFVLEAPCKVEAMIKCADDFGLDWVTVMSDPYCEAEDFGLPVEYVYDNLPKNTDYLIKDILDVDKLRVPDIYNSKRISNRIREVELFSKAVGDKYFIVGWAEGACAEYSDLRGLSEMCIDFFEYEDEINRAMDVILETTIKSAQAQIKVGAHCIGIGDAVCSQIGPKFYKMFGFEREKALVSAIHDAGGLAKLHICGDTTDILPDMIATGADIIDVDHLVIDMSKFIGLLGKTQVLSGNSDPVEIVYRGNRDLMAHSIKVCMEQTKGRGIISAGCEIPVQTTVENFMTYCNLAREQVL